MTPTSDVPPRASVAEYMECGGKRSATPLWSHRAGLKQQKRRRRFALPAHSKWCYIQGAPPSAIFFCLAFSLCLSTLAADSPLPDHSAQIAKAADALRPSLVQIRRDLHMHPELANREERTARVVADKLRALGIDEIKTNIAHHGVVALLKGARPGPVVAIRADMDALPIHETIDVPYKSAVPGVKHACGHDVHTTIALGVAEILSKMRGEI